MGSTSESSPVRMHWKLSGFIHICCEVLQLLQSDRITLTEVQDIFVSFGYGRQVGLCGPTTMLKIY